MRPRLAFAITLIVLAESLALASPSPLIREVRAVTHDAVQSFVIDTAIVWSVFVLACLVGVGIVWATRRLVVGRVRQAPSGLPSVAGRAPIDVGRSARAMVRS